jgi:hypothetical protein
MGVIIAIFLFAITIAGLVIYAHRHGQPEARAADFVPAAIKTLGVPWNTRAENTLTQMMHGVDGSSIALSALKIAHPTGKTPQLTTFTVNPSGAGITASFEVSWQGELSGKIYKTLVIWECNQQSHLRGSVTQDTAPTAVTDKAQSQLDEYFRTEVYPVLCKDLQ